MNDAEFVSPQGLTVFYSSLIAFITRSEVNDCAISNDFLLASIVTTRVSLEEVCPAQFRSIELLVDLVASCLDGDEIPLKVIATFSASRFAARINSFNSSPQLGHVCLLVHGFNKVSPFLPFVHTDTVLDVFIHSWQFR